MTFGTNENAIERWNASATREAMEATADEGDWKPAMRACVEARCPGGVFVVSVEVPARVVS